LSEVFQLQNIHDLPSQLAELRAPGVAQDAVLLCSDGTRRDIRWNATPIQHGDSQAPEFAIIFYDVTQEKHLTRRTKNYDRLQSLGILAGGIADNFNNNLAAILASIDCVTSVKNTNEVQALDVAKLACQKAKQLTQQLLKFSRGGVPLRKPSDIREYSANFSGISHIGAPHKYQLASERKLAGGDGRCRSDDAGLQ